MFTNIRHTRAKHVLILVLSFDVDFTQLCHSLVLHLLALKPVAYLLQKYFEVKASVPGASNKLGELVTEYVIYLHGPAQQRSPQKKRNLAQK